MYFTVDNIDQNVTYTTYGNTNHSRILVVNRLNLEKKKNKQVVIDLLLVPKRAQSNSSRIILFL